MKVFIAEHDGIYLGGHSVVVAEDRKEARKILRPIIKDMFFSYGKKASLSIKLEEVDTKTPNVVMVFNGDY
jgi:hypothetical protein